MLADEPTTGLDTFQAAEMVELLSEMGRSRHCATIMCLGSEFRWPEKLFEGLH